MEDSSSVISNLIQRFKDKEETHPQLATLWGHYLAIREERHLRLIRCATDLLDLMETTGDISLNVLALLYVMQRQLNNMT